MNDELLSRMAETLFWTGRYVERADDTARLVDVYVHRLLGDPATGTGGDCGPLFGILGVEPGDGTEPDVGAALFRLAYDTKSPSAIAGAILSARAGARGIREVISSEMWECLNVAGHGLAGQRRAAERLGPHVFLRFIRERSALFFGLAESTMSHDDAWRFLVLGRSLERADMTARLLLARMPGPQELGWPLLLHACGAYESFIRTHGWAAEPTRVAEFLLLDRLFPRSVLHSLVTAEECLMALNPGSVRSGMDDPARRPVGQLRTRLEYADPALLTEELPELLGQLQQACVEAGHAIGRRYFQYEAPVAWEKGRLSVSWRLRVVHTTQVSYTAPVRTSFNEARMTPLTLPSQATLESKVSAGSGVPVWTYCDYWGTFVSVFDITEPHQALTITAQATIETGLGLADTEAEARLPWDELRARAGTGRLLEFLLPTPLTTVTPEVAATVLAEVRDADPVETATEIAARVRAQVSYMAGSTGVRTNAQEAWDQGQGVCQDMAHVTVALLREAGLPARYVSGYLHANPDAEPGQGQVGESHAWVEYWAGSWLPCDPTSGAPVRERHVVVARGRDYGDIPPLKGIYHGAPTSALDVTVEVTRLA